MEATKVHLILTGATGLVGSATLNSMLRNPTVSRISIFTRPKSDVVQATDSEIAQQKCRIFKHEDFAQPPSVETLDGVKDATGCVWALGVSQNEVDEQTYQKITVDWPLTWARALAKKTVTQMDSAYNFSEANKSAESGGTTSKPSEIVDSPMQPPNTGKDESERVKTPGSVASTHAAIDPPKPSNDNTPKGDESSTVPSSLSFVYVSGEGATHEPGRFTPRFGRMKGVAEKSLIDLAKAEDVTPGLNVYIARAGAVDRADHDEITKYTAAREGLQKKLERPVRIALRYTYKKLMSPTQELGDALVQLAMRDGSPMPDGPGIEGEGRIIRNVGLRHMVGLSK